MGGERYIMNRFPYLTVVSYILLLLVVIPPLCQAGPRVYERALIKQDTVWQGDILIKGDVEVTKEAILTIMPGTVIRFAKIDQWGPEKLYADRSEHFPRAELIVKGRIIAQGTRQHMIIFTSADTAPGPADWGAINMLDSRGNLMEFCEFSFAHTAVHCHSAQVLVASCYFHDNGVAIGMKNVNKYKTRCVASILYNRIVNNGGGILFGNGASPNIVNNLLEGNKIFAIFAKKAGPALIRYNNITKNGKGLALYATPMVIFSYNNVEANRDYNVSLFEGQNYDVYAPDNWWGTRDEKEIRKLTWDKDEEKDLGRLLFHPYATAPIEGAGIPFKIDGLD